MIGRGLRCAGALAAVWVCAVLWADWSARAGVPVQTQAGWIHSAGAALAAWAGAQGALAWLIEGGAWAAANPGPLLGAALFVATTLGLRRKTSDASPADSGTSSNRVAELERRLAALEAERPTDKES